MCRYSSLVNINPSLLQQTKLCIGKESLLNCIASLMGNLAIASGTEFNIILDQASPYFDPHEADPQSRSIVIIVFSHVVHSYVRTSPLYKTKQISSENNVRYWRNCGGLAEWIIDDTGLVIYYYIVFISQAKMLTCLFDK